ncbi:unnamed protein product [Moneuplotes crassus]|uniref:Uncharacterized protein n=1 Tax=Euplotes crassus TaxID=5936 RepID=A0AAD1U780_EUPCR|nr:unnamed protein product [Moneuplotes crassus]
MVKKILKTVGNTTLKFCIGRIRGLDMYPKTINFTYKGNEEFKTVIGGIISLGIHIIIIMYTLSLFNIMMANKNSSKSINTSVKNLREDTEIVNLENTTFQFAFTALIDDSPIDIAAFPQYFTPEVNMYSKTKSQTFPQQTTVPFSKCGDNFKYYNQSAVKDLGIDQYYCPNSRDFKIQGNSLSNAFNLFGLDLLKCNSTTSTVGCESDANINDFIKEIEIGIFVVSSYFDFEDYDSPIKTYLDDRFFYRLLPGYTKEYYVRIQKNSIETQDNYFAYKPGGDESEIYEIQESSLFNFTIENNLSVEGATSKTLLSVQFVKDPFARSYDRGVYTILAVIGDIGGLLGVFMVAGGLVVNLFSEKLFFYSFLKKVIQVEEPIDKQERERGCIRVRDVGRVRISGRYCLVKLSRWL